MKKVLALLLTLVLLAGCAGKQAQDAPSGGNELSNVEAVSTVPTEESSGPEELEVQASIKVTVATAFPNGDCSVVGEVMSGEFQMMNPIFLNREDTGLVRSRIKLMYEADTKAAAVEAGEGDRIILTLEQIDADLMQSGDTLFIYVNPPTAETVEAPEEKPVLSADYLNEAFAQLEQYARAGDIRLLDYLVWEKEENEAGMRAILENDEARELWCAAFAPTTMLYPEFDKDIDLKYGSIDMYKKAPVWAYVDQFHLARTGCQPLAQDAGAIEGYFNAYAKEIPYRYSVTHFRSEEGTPWEDGFFYGAFVDGALKVGGENFVREYLQVSQLRKAPDNPLAPFQDYISTGLYIAGLPEQLTEEQQLLVEYYRLVADNQFFQAIELVQDTPLAIKSSTTLNKILALSDEEKAVLQAEIDKLPKGEVNFFTHIGGSDTLYPDGFLLSPSLRDDKDYEIFGEGVPVIETEVTFCFLSPSGDPSLEHFPALYQLVNDME